jgi:hypothetical protein
MEILAIGCLGCVLLGLILISLRQCLAELRALNYNVRTSATESKDRLSGIAKEVTRIRIERR